MKILLVTLLLCLSGCARVYKYVRREEMTVTFYKDGRYKVENYTKEGDHDKSKENRTTLVGRRY